MEERQEPLQDLSADRLELLYRLSQSFNSSLELDEVLNKVMDEVIVATGAERGFIILVDQEGDYEFQVARGMALDTIERPESEVSHGVVDKVLETREPIVSMDAITDEHFGHRDSVRDLGLRSVVCVPLIIQDRLLGAIYIDNRLRQGIFGEREEDLLIAIASNASIAIENARLYQVAIEKGRIERELQLARGVQENQLPKAAPNIPGWELATRWVPARAVAGDFFDFIEVESGWGILIADVVDKGMPAALFMAGCRATLRAAARQAVDAADIAAAANQVICTDTTTGMFLSFVLVMFEPDARELTYVNAGHPPPLHYHHLQGTMDELPRTGMIAGVDPEAAYESRSLTMEPGDYLLMYTDGVTDVMNEAGDLYGEDRFLELIGSLDAQAPAEVTLSSIKDGLDKFSGPTLPTDDITLVMIRKV